MEKIIIQLDSRAPDKPDYGAPCNGCGVCCAVEPCPVAFVWLWQFKGRCRALHWLEAESRYRCGLVVCPDRWVPWIPKRLAPRFGRWIATRIAAGYGCDSDAWIETVADELD